MSGIFISYRRDDSRSAAGRLTDGLAQAFGRETIFRDVVTISAGTDFVEAIEGALASCVVLLAVIGPRWLEMEDGSGRRRLDDPTDFTRREVETALTHGICVIPVLVDGARMPAAADLPDGLKLLARRQAIELTDQRWDYDVGKVIERLGQIDGLPAAEAIVPATPRKHVLRAVLAGAAAAATGLLYAGEPLARWSGLDALIPEQLREFLQERTQDGSTVLVVFMVLIFVGALLENSRYALSGAFGGWSRNGRAVGMIAAYLVAVALLVAHDRLVTAAVLTVVAVACWVVTRIAPAFFLSAAKAIGSALAAMAVLGVAWWADKTLEDSRESVYDVAFLLPPDGGHSVQAEDIFKRIKDALAASLKDVATIKIVPDRLSPVDFSRYEFTRQDELLAYRAKEGYARIFIRSKYNHDSQSQSLSILVTPYQRMPGGKALQPLWTHPAWVAHATPNETSRIALQATFDLVSFLSSKDLIKLKPDEQQQFWRNLLTEYGQLLAVTHADCAVNAELQGMLPAGNALDETTVRRVLSAPCTQAPRESIAAASNNPIDTVTMLYGKTLSP